MMNNKKKVLIIEDELPLQKAVYEKLVKEGFDCVVSRTVDKALELIKTDCVDAVWLDHYLLGGKNGLDFVKEIKNCKKCRDIHILVVSNTASPDKLKTYISLGVDKYFIKAENRLENIIKDLKEVLENSK